MNPYDAPEMYDRIVLGQSLSPGVVKLSGHDRDKDWDVKKAKGQVGASSSLNGEPVGEFTATFTLVKDYETGVDEISEWDAFQRVIESTVNGQRPVALPIYHPDLARNRFTEVSAKKIGGMVHDGKGGATVVVQFLEYRPPKPKPVTRATGGQTSSTIGVIVPSQVAKPPKPDPNAAAKAELAALLREARTP